MKSTRLSPTLIRYWLSPSIAVEVEIKGSQAFIVAYVETTTSGRVPHMLEISTIEGFVKLTREKLLQE